jgi:hypothetical protein
MAEDAATTHHHYSRRTPAQPRKRYRKKDNGQKALEIKIIFNISALYSQPFTLLPRALG